MPSYTVCSNFLLTDRMRGVIDAFLPRQEESKELLPYLAWALEVRQMDGEKIIKRTGPGYVLGAIERMMINDGIVIAVDQDRHIAIALRDAYDDQLTYTVDCVDRQFSIVAA